MSNDAALKSETFKKDGHTMVRLNCVECKTEFVRRAAEVKRNNKRGFGAFCSRSCSAQYGNKRRLYDDRPEEHRNEDWTPFYILARCCRKNSKQRKKDYTLTPEYLKALWKEQKGKCALSGVVMQLPHHKEDWTKTPTRVSVDRIDSSIGYVLGNIQLITCMANYCKHTWSNNDVVEFAKAVTKFNQVT